MTIYDFIRELEFRGYCLDIDGWYFLKKVKFKIDGLTDFISMKVEIVKYRDYCSGWFNVSKARFENNLLIIDEQAAVIIT